MGPAEDRPDEQQAEEPAAEPRQRAAKKSAGSAPSKAVAKKAVAKKAAKRPAAKKPAAKKTAAKEPAAKKTPAARAGGSKTADAQAPGKKAASEKPAATRATTKKATPEKAAATKAPADKSAAKKPAAKKPSGESAPPSSVATPAATTDATAPQAEPAAPSAATVTATSAPAKPRRRGGRFRKPEIVSQPTTSPIPKVPTRDPRRLQQRVAVVIPAKDEARRIAATVRSAKSIPQVDLVLVVDDGSEDNTQHVARDAGAVVVRHSHNRGKAAAMETGAAVVAMRDTPERPPRLLLFIDADLGETAVNTAPLIPPVAEHAADFSIALLPPQVGAGGRGMVVSAARKGIARLTGWAPTQPLSGMRCLTRAAFEAATPLARGWGVETGMTIDLLRQGFVAVEVPCDLRHRPSGNDLGGQLHRAAQYRDVQLALSARRVRSAARSLKQAVTPGGPR